MQTSKPEETLYTDRYAMSYLSVIPLRAETSHRSEMVSQVLFGEYAQVLKTSKEWSYIRLEQDGYEGWVESAQLLPVTKKNYEDYKLAPKYVLADEAVNIMTKYGEIRVLKGSNLPFYKNGSFELNGAKIPVNATLNHGKKDRKHLVETAMQYLNTPYLWGGKTRLGIDCSGFSQMVYHSNGYDIMRDASQQATQGELVAFLEQALPGDLAFFDNKEGHITHVGIVLGNGEIIHAAHGKVHIDKLDSEGIFNLETKKYSHHLRMVRRYF